MSPKLKKVKPGRTSSSVWFYACSPDGGEIGKISKLTKVGSETLEDALDVHELPRVEMEKESLVAILRVPILEKGVYKTEPMTVVLGKDFVLTVTRKKNEILEDFIAGKSRIYTDERSKMFVKMCSDVILKYQRYISGINRGIQNERSRFRNITQQEIAKLVESEEVLNDFVSSLRASVNVMKKVFGMKKLGVYLVNEEVTNDLLIDAEQVLDLATTNLRTIRNIRDGYTTLMSMRLNQVMKLLTYVTVLFTVPMIITGFYGMNVALPGAGSENAYLMIGGITGLIILVFVVLILIYRKKI